MFLLATIRYYIFAISKFARVEKRLVWSRESYFLWYEMRPIVGMVVNRLINTEMGWLSEDSSTVQ